MAEMYPSSPLVRRFSASARDMATCQKNIYRIIKSIIQERAVMPMPERDEDLLGVLLRLQREGGLQFALTNEILSTVIFVRSAYLTRLSSNAHNTFLCTKSFFLL